MARLVDGKSTEDLERYLRGVKFPARKDQIVHAARQAGAPIELIGNLERMTVQEFNSALEVVRAYGTMA